MGGNTVKESVAFYQKRKIGKYTQFYETIRLWSAHNMQLPVYANEHQSRTKIEEGSFFQVFAFPTLGIGK